MKRIFVDTDVLIDYSKGYSHQLQGLLEKQKQNQVELYTNPIVIAEFFTDENLRNEKKRQTAKEFFYLFKTITVSKKIGLLSGELLREKKVNYLGDSLIAATCLINDLFLLTNNRKDFSKVRGIKLSSS